MIMGGAGPGGGGSQASAYANQGVPIPATSFGSGVSFGSGQAPTNAGSPSNSGVPWGVTPSPSLDPWMSALQNSGLLMRNIDPALLQFFNKMGGGGSPHTGGPYRHVA